MNDDLENPISFLGKPGEAVAEVDPDKLKSLWQLTRSLQANSPPGQHLGVSSKLIGGTEADAAAVWYRSSMIRLLHLTVQERLSPWIKDDELSDAVFKVMASIPMEWIGHTERQGLPFDVEEFFRRLRQAGQRTG